MFTVILVLNKIANAQYFGATGILGGFLGGSFDSSSYYGPISPQYSGFGGQSWSGPQYPNNIGGSNDGFSNAFNQPNQFPSFNGPNGIYNNHHDSSQFDGSLLSLAQSALGSNTPYNPDLAVSAIGTSNNDYHSNINSDLASSAIGTSENRNSNYFNPESDGTPLATNIQKRHHALSGKYH